MKRLKLFLLTLPFYSSTIAQPLSNQSEPVPLNNVYVSFIGDASIFALNYERLNIINPKIRLSSRIGLGYNELIALFTPRIQYITIPHHVTCNFGEGQHFLEAGLGGTFLAGQGKEEDIYGRKVPATVTHYLLYPIIGYRFHPLQSSKLNFRLYAQPIIRNSKAGWFSEKSGAVVIPFGASVGLSF